MLHNQETALIRISQTNREESSTSSGTAVDGKLRLSPVTTSNFISSYDENIDSLAIKEAINATSAFGEGRSLLGVPLTADITGNILLL
jgi:hypothetical protein